MSMLTTPPAITCLPPSWPMRRFSVDEYHRLIEIGLFTEDDRVELLDGWIVWKLPHEPLHDVVLELTDEQIRPHLPPDWRLRVRSAITLSESEPEPDLTIVSGAARLFLRRHPGPADIALVAEVSDASLSRDRVDKGQF